MEGHNPQQMAYYGQYQEHQFRPTVSPSSSFNVGHQYQAPVSPSPPSFHASHQMQPAVSPPPPFHVAQQEPLISEKPVTYELPGSEAKGHQYGSPQPQNDYKGPISPSYDVVKPGDLNQYPRPTKNENFYVPTLLRLPSLFIVFLITAGLIGVLQWGIKTIPHSSRHLGFSDFQSATAEVQSLTSNLHRRLESTPVPLPSVADPSSTPTPTKPITSAPPPGGNIGTISSTTSASTTIPSALSSGANIQDGSYSISRSFIPPSIGGATTPGGNVPVVNTGIGTFSAYTTYAVTSKVTTSLTYVTSVSSTIVTTDSQGHQTTTIALIPSTTVEVQAVQTTFIPAQQPGVSPNFAHWKIFVGNYLIVFLVVLFRQIWTAINSQAKLIEPFTCLYDGASARQVFDILYLSSSFIPEPILAIMNNHWLTMWTSVIYLLVGFLGPVAAESLFLDTNYPNCPFKNNNPVNPCLPPRISIDPILARVLQGMLTFIAIMTLTMMVMVWRLRSGVYSDPSSIAGITALVHHPALLQDFRLFGPEITSKEMMRIIGKKRYKLDDYQTSDGTWRYGIVPESVGQMSHGIPTMEFQEPRFRVWALIDAIMDLFFLFAILGLLGIVAGYYKDGKDDGFNRFFNKTGFGPRFMLTTVATIIALLWRRLERNVHTLSAYHRLGQTPPADARSTILLRKSSTPLSSIFPMLFKRHYFASFIAIVAVLADPLIILAGAIPFNPGHTDKEFRVASYVAMGILGLMVIALITSLIWRRRLPDLPREPDTIAAVISYVSESTMVKDFEGLEYVGNHEINRRVEGLNRRYTYGKKPGMDGVTRFLVDEA